MRFYGVEFDSSLTRTPSNLRSLCIDTVHVVVLISDGRDLGGVDHVDLRRREVARARTLKSQSDLTSFRSSDF